MYTSSRACWVHAWRIQRLRSTARALPSTDSRMILCASGSFSSDPSTLTMAPSSSSSFLRMGTEGRVTESQRRIRQFSRHERGGCCIPLRGVHRSGTRCRVREGRGPRARTIGSRCPSRFTHFFTVGQPTSPGGSGTRVPLARGTCEIWRGAKISPCGEKRKSLPSAGTVDSGSNLTCPPPHFPRHPAPDTRHEPT